MIVAIYEDEVATSKDISLYNSDNIKVCMLKQQPCRNRPHKTFVVS